MGADDNSTWHGRVQQTDHVGSDKRRVANGFCAGRAIECLDDSIQFIIEFKDSVAIDHTGNRNKRVNWIVTDSNIIIIPNPNPIDTEKFTVVRLDEERMILKDTPGAHMIYLRRLETWNPVENDSSSKTATN